MAADPKDLVAQLRAMLAMTQTKFAELIGVTQSCISEWESGIRRPQADDWQRMAIVAPHGYAESYYVMAAIEDRNVAMVARANKGLVDVVKGFNPSRGVQVEREIQGLTVDEQFDRLIGALNEIAAEAVPARYAHLCDEDRELIKRTLEDSRKNREEYERLRAEIEAMESRRKEHDKKKK